MSSKPAHTRYSLVFAILALGITAWMLVQSVVLPALPAIQQELDASTEAAAWVITAYLLSASVTTPLFGRFGDMFGHKRMLVIGLGLFTAGGVVASFASSIEVLIVARVLQGAAAVMLPLSISIIREHAPPRRMTTDVALISGLMGVGGAIGLLVAGPILSHLGYRYLFALPAIVAAITFVASILLIPESPTRVRERVDFAGAVTLVGWLVALLVGLTQGRSWGWTSTRTLTLFALAAVLLVFWIAIELRQRAPLVDMDMMRLRRMWTTNLATLLIGFGMFASYLVMPQLVELPASAGGLGASVTQTGLFFVPSAVMVVLAGRTAGRLATSVGARVPLALGALVSAAAFFMTLLAHDEHWQIYLDMTVFGAGVGLTMAATANLIVESVPLERTGVATGMNMIVRTIGGAFGAQVSASIIASSIGGSGVPTLQSFEIALALAGSVVFLGFLAALLVPERRRSPRKRAERRSVSRLARTERRATPDA